MIRFWLSISTFVVICIPLRAANSVETPDGLAVDLSDAGRVVSITLDKKPIPLANDPVLFRIRDVGGNAGFVPITAAVHPIAGGVRLQSADHESDLDLAATLISHGPFIQIDGTITDRLKSNRCIDLKISLPIAQESFKFDTGLSGEPPRKRPAKKRSTEAIDEKHVQDDSSIYPISPGSDIVSNVGISLAVPPTSPTRFLTGLDNTGLYILLRIGLSPASAHPDQTAFHVILYRHEPAWGFRSSLERYYEFYRNPLCTPREKNRPLDHTQRFTTH